MSTLASGPVFQGHLSVQRRTEKEFITREKIHRLALEEAADPIVVYDVEGGAAFVNSAFARVFGWSAEELLGRKIPFVPEESMKETKALIRRILDGERCLDFETKRQTKYGELLDVSLSAASISNDNAISHIVVNLRDITDHNRALKQVLKNDEHLRQLADNLEEVFWLSEMDTNDEIKLLYVSPGVKNFFGLSPSEVYSRSNSWGALVLEEDVSLVEKAIYDFLHNHKNYNIQYRILNQDNSVRWISGKGTVVCDIDEKRCRFVEVSEDITIMKNTEMIKFEKQKLKGVLEMAGAAAHEISQPLQVIMSETSFLSSEVMQDIEIKESLGALEEATTRLGHVINHIQNITKYKTEAYAQGQRIIDIRKASSD